VIDNAVSFPTLTWLDSKPAALIISVDPGGTLMAKLPYWSAETAVVVPFTIMVTKGIGSPPILLTCPVSLVDCDQAADANSSIVTNKQ
jgi:hypothetical protein